MRFRLRTVLVVVTVACILMAVGQRIVSRRHRLREHHLAFSRVDSAVSSLDSKLRQKILGMPAVFSQIQQVNPVDPPMALAHSISGESMAFGTHQFTRSFHYDWQMPNGSRSEGIQITVSSVLKEDSFDAHVVRLTYETNNLNDAVASWIDEQLSQNAHVRVIHNKLRHQPPGASCQRTDFWRMGQMPGMPRLVVLQRITGNRG